MKNWYLSPSPFSPNLAASSLKVADSVFVIRCKNGSLRMCSTFSLIPWPWPGASSASTIPLRNWLAPVMVPAATRAVPPTTPRTRPLPKPVMAPPVDWRWVSWPWAPSIAQANGAVAKRIGPVMAPLAKLYSVRPIPSVIDWGSLTMKYDSPSSTKAGTSSGLWGAGWVATSNSGLWKGAGWEILCYSYQENIIDLNTSAGLWTGSGCGPLASIFLLISDKN